MDIVISKMMSKPDFQSDFLANILKANANPDIITFAGGLPNAVSFPVEAMDRAADKVLKENGIMALQYSGAQGYAPLRKFIADRYQKKGYRCRCFTDYHNQRFSTGIGHVLCCND